MIRIPENGIFSQPNRGDIFGNINRTQNIDFKTSPGKLKVSSRLKVNTKDNDTSISNMGVPLAFVTHDKSSTKQYYAACGIGTGFSTGSGKMFVSASSAITSAFANDTTSNTPTTIHADFSDMVNWRDRLYVTTYDGSNSRIFELYSSWDTNFLNTRGGAFKTQGGVKNMWPGFNGNLYFTDDDEINYIPPSGNAVQTGTGTIDMQGQYRGIWGRSSSSYNWIGLMTFDANVGSRGYVARWNGSGTQFNNIYDIDAPCALSCTIVDDNPYIVDAYGILKMFTGGGFSEVARLPVANLNIEMPGIYSDISNARWIHQRGMDVVDGKININVNNLVSTGVYVDEMPSGIWEYDPKRPELGLYHKSSPCADTTDWGQKYISAAGAIFGSKRSTATYLAGFGYYTDDVTTERKGIFYDDIATDTNKRGIVQTPFINSPNITDTWQDISYRFTPLGGQEKIISKYRTVKDNSYPVLASITWTSTTTFTTTNAHFGGTVQIGDEVEVVMGKSSGTTAHITNITGTGTYTVTLDDTIGHTSGTAKVRVYNFKKLDTISGQNISEKTLGIGKSDTRVQIKNEIRANGAFELDDLTLINRGHKLAK